jgi:hypothetical protein
METHREMTEDWLRQHKVRYHSMHMRATGDYRKDEIVKLEMLKHIRGGGYQVEFAVDDRPTVVKMWRANGVPCFVCDDTEWIIAKHATIEAVRKDLMDRSNAGFRKFVKDEKNFDIRMSLEKTYEETLENACALRAAINALPAETK